MSRFRPSYIPALLSIALGVYWIISQLISPLIQYPAETKPLSEFIFYYIALAVVLLPGLALVFFGTALLRNITKESIKNCIGNFAILGSIWPSLEIYELINSLTETSRTLHFTSYFVSAIILFSLYALISKYLMKAEGIANETKGEFINRGNLKFLAILIAFSLDELLRLPFDPKYKYSKFINEPWNTVILLLSFSIALIFYFVVARLLPKENYSKEKPSENLLFDDLSMEEVRELALKKEPQDSC